MSYHALAAPILSNLHGFSMKNYSATNRSSWQIDRLKRCLQVSQHDPHLYSLLYDMNVYILLPLCVAGVALNLLALCCLHRPPKITSGVIVYLNLLLVVDIIQLSTTATQVIPFRCDYATRPNQTWYGFCYGYRQYASLFISRFVATADTLQMWSITALAAHRYWKISRPLDSRMKDTKAKAWCLVFWVVLLSVSFRLPMFCELKVRYQPKLDRIVIGLNYRLVNDYWYNVLYYLLANSVFYHLIPFCAMSAFSYLTVRAIRQRARRQRHTNKRETRATLSILSIVVFFVIFHCLSLFEMLRRWYVLLGFTCHSRADFLLTELSVLLAMFSSALNALIFIAVTNRVKMYLEVLARRASRLSSGGSSDTTVPSPRTPRRVGEATSRTSSYRTRVYSDTVF